MTGLGFILELVTLELENSDDPNSLQEEAS